jgi:hypothetical protein
MPPEISAVARVTQLRGMERAPRRDAGGGVDAYSATEETFAQPNKIQQYRSTIWNK